MPDNRPADTSARVLQSSRREARFTAAMWIACCVWTVGCSALFGYSGDPSAVLAGIPTWVVWGVLAPWFLASAVTCWYALLVMRDEDLGEDAPAPDEEAHG